MEKPMAATLADADAMIGAMAADGAAAGDQLAACLVTTAPDGEAALR
jgi:hypothetical protein